MPMYDRCCVPGCNSFKPNCPGLSFHRIPVNKELARKWLQQIKNPKLCITHLQNERVCGRHFKKEQFKHLNKNLLKGGVIPVLFMPEPTTFSVIHNSLMQKLFPPNNPVENVNVPLSKDTDNSPEPSINTNPRQSYDFKKTCRICLLEKEDLQNIESDFIQNMFQFCDVLKFSDNDTFPKQICDICISELKIVYSFSKKCSKSSDILQEYIEKLSTTNPEEESQGFSETVEISYVPSVAENLNTESQHRYLFLADGIENPEILFSAGDAEISGLENNSIIETTVTNSASNSNIIENNLTNTTNNVGNTKNKRTLRKRKSNTVPALPTKKPGYITLVSELPNAVPALPTKKPGNITLVSELPNAVPGLPTKKPGNITVVSELPTAEKPVTVLVSEQVTEKSQNSDIIQEKDNSKAVMDIFPTNPDSKSSEDDIRTEKLAHQKSSRQPRSVVIKSRMSTQSRTVKSLTKPRKRYAIRKKIASDNPDTVYWYDKKSTTSSTNQIAVESTPLLNSESSQISAKAASNEVLGSSNNSEGITNDLSSITSSEKTNNIETALNNVSTEVNTHFTPVSDNIKTSVDSLQKNEEIPAQIEQINSTKPAENNIPKRGRGRPRKIRIELKTESSNSSEPSVGKPDNTAAGITKSDNAVADATENCNKTPENGNAVECKTNNTTTCITAACNSENGNSVKRTPRNNNARSGNTAININKGNKTVSEEKPDINTSLFLPKISNMNDNTAAQQVLPTEEKGTLFNDCQQNSDKITKQDKATSNGSINNNDYMKLRRRSVRLDLNSPKNIKLNLISPNENDKLNLNSQNNNVLPNNLNIKHLSKKELNKLLSVKLELNKSTIKNNLINTVNKISKAKRKTKILNKPMVEHHRQLRSSKRNVSSLNKEKDCALPCSDAENMELTKKSAVKNVQQLDSSIVDKDKVNNPFNNASEPTKLAETTLSMLQKEEEQVNSNSCESDIPYSVNNIEQNACLENNKIEQTACSEKNKIEQTTYSENNNTIDETCYKNNSEQETCSDTTALNAQKSITEHNTSMEEVKKPEHDTCSSNIQAEQCSENFETELKCSPDTTTKHDARSLEREDYVACSANSKMEQDECSLNSKTAYEICSPDSKAENETCSQTEHDYCSVNSKTEHEPRSSNNKTEYDTCSPNNKTEYDICSPNNKTEHAICSPNKTEHVEYLTNNIIEHDTCSPNNKNTLENITVTDDEDNVSKNQIMELLTEFVVFPNDTSDSTTLKESSTDTNTDVPTEQDSPNKYYKLLDSSSGSQMLEDNVQIIHSDAMLGLKGSPQLTASVPTVCDEMPLNDSFENTINNFFYTEYNTVYDGQLVDSSILFNNDVSREEVVVTTVENENEPDSYQYDGETDQKIVYFNKNSGMIVASNEYSSNRFDNSWVPSVKTETKSINIIDNIIIKPGQKTSYTSDTSDNIVNYLPIPTQKCETSTVAGTIVERNLPHVYTVGNTGCPDCKQSVNVEYGDTFCCEYCGYIFSDSNSIISKKSQHIDTGLYECLFCKMQFTTRLSFHKHLTVHSDLQQIQCKQCLRKFSRTYSLISHLAKASCLKKEKYKCSICNETFSLKVKYTKHLVMHKRYICYVCNQTFKSKKCHRQHLTKYCQKRKA